MKKLLFVVFLSLAGALVQAMPAEELAEIQHDWAVANYNTPEDGQEKAFEKLVAKARDLVKRYPDEAAPKVWLAISLSTDAGVNGGFGALGKVKEAKKLLEAAEKIDPQVLNGSIYTSLGSLYYQVPGWPIAFGNDDKAEQYLKKALQINPQGIDSNYFYADFLLEQDQPKKALKYLEKALAAPPRPGRPLADKGRRQEVQQAMARARNMLD
ncbi:tetratricopeptide repeat protein [Thiolapillus sp.]